MAGIGEIPGLVSGTGAFAAGAATLSGAGFTPGPSAGLLRPVLRSILRKVQRTI